MANDAYVPACRTIIHRQAVCLVRLRRAAELFPVIVPLRDGVAICRKN
jgi:hypothetical protein